MSAMASQLTGVSIVCSTVGSCADQTKHQSSASLAFVWGIHRSPVNSPHKWPITRKMFHLMTSSCDRWNIAAHQGKKISFLFQPDAEGVSAYVTHGTWEVLRILAYNEDSKHMWVLTVRLSIWLQDLNLIKWLKFSLRKDHNLPIARSQQHTRTELWAWIDNTST